MSNRLQYETSPYLLQHAENPVDWYPWGEEAFEKAKSEDKPIFLSIGYSTCHWCHVMARESFENAEIADTLNRYFVSVKVDREERPDVDQVYMNVCQALTGSGGWPTSLFLTPQLKPFFAGTYFPPKGRGSFAGFYELICLIAKRWREDRKRLIESAENIVSQLKERKSRSSAEADGLVEKAIKQFSGAFDEKNGGFGCAPKFPTPHNLLFLLLYGYLKKDDSASLMASFTMTKMQRGGIYDQVGGGFCRYSTDEIFLVPHFEKMLYDNALLITAYSAGYALSENREFLATAERCADYVLKEMADKNGGFYSAQDADTEDGEGAFYLFGHDEILSVLGKEKGKAFNDCYGVTETGNFEGKNILNRLNGGFAEDFSDELSKLYSYRKQRMKLRLDDKILTVWNSLTIVAFNSLYRVTGKSEYLQTALSTARFIENELCEKDRLYVGIRQGKRFGKGFFDDYAFYCWALLSLYSVTGEDKYLERAKTLAVVTDELFSACDGGYVTNGKENEQLIISAKETYDGAMPSANSAFFYVLTRLNQLDVSGKWADLREKQKKFLSAESADLPFGHSMFTASLLVESYPPAKIVVVCKRDESISRIIPSLPFYADIKPMSDERREYKLLNGKTTYYVCKNNVCLPPSNDLKDLID
ncbi:MAG: thioredoxin domain-containing protein [Christensenellaceae bacterium]